MRLISISSTRKSRRASAFTLVEILTAIGIIGIVSVSLYAGLAMSFNSVQNSRLELRATHILTEKLEAIRLFNWDQVNDNNFIPKNFTERYQPSESQSVVYHVKVTLSPASVPSAYAGTMKKVVAEISWISSGRKCQKQMETFISQYGIQNYLY